MAVTILLGQPHPGARQGWTRQSCRLDSCPLATVLSSPLLSPHPPRETVISLRAAEVEAKSNRRGVWYAYTPPVPSPGKPLPNS
jgi:hypothetical protein